MKARQTISGARSGALVAGASAASIVANYVFLLAAGRILGSARYGSLAALLGALAVVLIPATALQMAVSRDVSRRIASGDAGGANALARATIRTSLLATVPLLVLAGALAVPLRDLLHIHSLGVVLLAETTLVTALVYPATLGVLQGLQRFYALAALYIVPQVFRLALLAVTTAAGFRLGGAIFATAASTVLTSLLALALIRDPLEGAAAFPRAELMSFLRYLTPVAIGLIGIALLTHVDILVVKARLSANDAGAYAAASAFARVGFFLPATILTVLFPRTAARQARGEQTDDILGRSLVATIVFCGLLALAYAATGVGILSTTFGPSFAHGGRVLAPFAIAIGLFSVAYILVGYHLSRGETRYAWIVAAGVVVQVALLSTVPSTLRGVVWTNLAVAAGLVAAHEIFVGSSVPALRLALRQTRGVWLRVRATLPEAALVLTGATALTCALFWPIVEHLGSTIIGHLGSDSTGSVAWFWEARHESGFHILGSVHHTVTGAPLGWDETNALELQVMLPYYPTYLAAKVVGDVAAYNLITLAGYVLPALAMYALVRYLRCSRLVAAWAALVCVVFPWHIARAEHGSLLHIEVLALLLFTLIAATRQPTLLRFGFVGAATLACWFTSGYYGAMAVITAIAFPVGVAFTVQRRRAIALVLGSAAFAVVAAAMLGIAAAASGTNAGAGLHRQAQDLSALALRPIELVVPPVHHLVTGGAFDSFWLTRFHGSNPTEISNYLGLLTLALGVAWVAYVVRKRNTIQWPVLSTTAGLVATFVVAFLFALPSPIAGVPMPSRLLWTFVPAFRVPSRWDPLLMTSLLPLAAMMLERVRMLLAPRQWVAAGVVVLAMVVSFVELTVKPAPDRFRTGPVPPVYAAVEQTPRGVLAEYPLGNSDVFRFWQRDHGRPIVNDAAAGTPADDVRKVLLDPSQPGTAATLAALGVTAIAIHPKAIVDAEVTPRTPTAGKGYRLVARTADGDSAWQVTAAPAAAVVTLPGFGTPARDETGEIGFPLNAPSGVASFEIRSTAAQTLRLAFVVTPSGGGSGVLRVADSRQELAYQIGTRAPIAVNVAVPRGVSRLLVKTDSSVLFVVSPPHATRTAAAPALHADRLSPNPGF